MSSLQRQAISGIKWTTFQTGVLGITGPFLLIIKARFLSPEAFGYIAIILMIIGLFHMLESLGISQAIIQKDEITVQESSSLFYFNILLGSLLFGLLYISSSSISGFFSLPDLKIYLPIAGIAALITCPSLIFQAFLQKQMYFKELAFISISKSLIVFASTAIFLVFGFGVIGVVYGQIAGAAFGTVSIIAISFRYKTVAIALYFNPKKLIPFLRFGLFVSTKQLMTFIAERLDEVIIGYFLSAEILGIYFFGKNLLENLRSFITGSFANVLFPVLSKLKHDQSKLTKAYQHISRYIAFGAFPVFTGIAVTAHLFVPVIFGAQWTDSIIVFQVFSIALILLALTANVSTSLLYSVNKPDLVFYIDVVANCFYMISLFLFASHGMLAVLLAYSSYVVYKTLILQFYANRQLLDGFLYYFRELAMPAASALIMVMFVLVFQLITNQFIDPAWQLAGSILTGCIVYSILAWLFARETLYQLRSAIIKGEFT